MFVHEQLARSALGTGDSGASDVDQDDLNDDGEDRIDADQTKEEQAYSDYHGEKEDVEEEEDTIIVDDDEDGEEDDDDDEAGDSDGRRRQAMLESLLRGASAVPVTISQKGDSRRYLHTSVSLSKTSTAQRERLGFTLPVRATPAEVQDGQGNAAEWTLFLHADVTRRPPLAYYVKKNAEVNDDTDKETTYSEDHAGLGKVKADNLGRRRLWLDRLEQSKASKQYWRLYSDAVLQYLCRTSRSTLCLTYSTT